MKILAVNALRPITNINFAGKTNISMQEKQEKGKNIPDMHLWPRVNTLLQEYNIKNNLIENKIKRTEEKYDDELGYDAIFCYNKNNKLIQKRYFDDDGQIDMIRKYNPKTGYVHNEIYKGLEGISIVFFNPEKNGQILNGIQLNQYNRRIYTYSCEYDANSSKGKLTKINYNPYTQKCDSIEIGILKSDNFILDDIDIIKKTNFQHDGKTISEIIEYDEEGNITKEIIMRPKGKTIDRIIEYDDETHTKKRETKMKPDGKNLDYIIDYYTKETDEYIFPIKDCLKDISYTKTFYNKGKRTNTFYYDERDRIAREFIYDKNGEKIKEHIEYSYGYDKKSDCKVTIKDYWSDLEIIKQVVEYRNSHDDKLIASKVQTFDDDVWN